MGLLGLPQDNGRFEIDRLYLLKAARIYTGGKKKV
jgi:hypothetical protein